MSSRPWFQFHLSTLIVVVILAAILIGINLNGRVSTMPVQGDPNDYCTVVKRGWPQTFHYALYHRTGRYTADPIWYYKSMLLDGALLVGILFAEAAVWESVIRLREKRAAK